MQLDAVDLLGKLVAFDTRNPEGEEASALQFCAELLRPFSPDELEIESLPRRRGGPPTGWLFARFGTPRVLFNAHVDTVPVSGAWTQDPFQMQRRGARVTGLGVSDTKCGIAAFLSALAKVPPRDVAILISGDEEHGNEAMQAFLSNRNLDQVELALVSEPTGGRIATEHRGILHYEVTARGPGGHSSQADARPAPVLELSRAAARLADGGQGRDLCLNIAEIKSGAAFNVIPSQATLVVSARPAPGTRTEEVVRGFEAVFREVSSDFEVALVAAHPSFRSSRPEVLSELLGEGLPERSSVPFWTEAALFEAHGVNALVYGPGGIDEAHRADEGLELAALAQAERLFERVLRGIR